MRKLIAIGIIAGLFAPVAIGCGKGETKKSTEVKKDDKGGEKTETKSKGEK